MGFCVTTIATVGTSIYNSLGWYNGSPAHTLYTILHLVQFLFLQVAPWATAIFFFLVARAVALCYDDWTAEMLDATVRQTRPSAEVNLIST